MGVGAFPSGVAVNPSGTRAYVTNNGSSSNNVSVIDTANNMVVARVQASESEKFPGKKALSAAVARYYFKLLAYKDEYEVARLYSESDFVQRVNEQFEGDFKLTFHLAPPIMQQRDPLTGEPRKKVFGPWMLSVFSVLAKLRGLRGTPLDIFGYSSERKMERRLISDYEKTIEMLLGGVNVGNYDSAIDIASIPEYIRGYGHVKLAHLKDAQQREAELREQFRNPQSRTLKHIRIQAAA